MAKPARIDRPVEKSLSLPTSLVAKIELRLYSELEKRVPHGAFSKFVIQCVEEYLRREEEARKGASNANQSQES